MGEQSKESPILLAYNGPLNGLNWPIKGKLVVGRDPECDIVINDRQVSRHHAEISPASENSVHIEDLNSKNGTFVNGRLIIESETLKDGDEIKIALIQKFVYVSSDATLPLENILPFEKTTEKILFIDKKSRRIWIGEKELTPPLSVSQYELLQLLYEKENTVVPREEIVKTVWGETELAGVSEQAIDALVRRLRYRLKKIDPHQEYITTVRGVGFVLENNDYER